MQQNTHEWREEYRQMKSKTLTKRQIALLENGPASLSASWGLMAMHGDWKRMKGIKPDPEPPNCQSSLKEFYKRHF